MPYLTAFAVWTVATLGLYAAAVYAIIPRLTAAVGAFAPVVVAENVLLRNNGALTAALVGLSLVFVAQRPWLSGILIGLLTYKHQFGVLFPIALVASRNGRAFASAAATSMILTAFAAIVFGARGWPSFIDTLHGRNASLSLVWAKPISYSLKAATLCVGSLPVAPYVQIYDLCVLPIAVAFRVKDGLSRGFMPGERTAILIVFASLFLLLFASAEGRQWGTTQSLGHRL